MVSVEKNGRISQTVSKTGSDGGKVPGVGCLHRTKQGQRKRWIKVSWGTSVGKWGEEDIWKRPSMWKHCWSANLLAAWSSNHTAVCSIFLLNSISNHFLVENNSVGVQHILFVYMHSVLLANFKLSRRPAAGKTQAGLLVKSSGLGAEFAWPWSPGYGSRLMVQDVCARVNRGACMHSPSELP